MTEAARPVSLVTGAGNGLGRAIALALARRGDHVVVGDIDETGGRDTVAEILRHGGTGRFTGLDVASARSAETALADIAAQEGRLDNLVNNAGIEGVTAPLDAYPVEAWDRVVAINLRGAFLVMKFALPLMLRAGRGAIVNVGSTASLGGVAGMAAYTAAKHGLAGLTKAAALDYADRGIRVNAICPGSFRTAMSDRLFGDRLGEIMAGSTPMGRLGSLEEIAAAVTFLCSDAASFITGVALPVEGGKRAR